MGDYQLVGLVETILIGCVQVGALPNTRGLWPSYGGSSRSDGHQKGHRRVRAGGHLVADYLWRYKFRKDAPRRNRTYNLVIKSHLLCQLS